MGNVDMKYLGKRILARAGGNQVVISGSYDNSMEAIEAATKAMYPNADYDWYSDNTQESSPSLYMPRTLGNDVMECCKVLGAMDVYVVYGGLPAQPIDAEYNNDPFTVLTETGRVMVVLIDASVLDAYEPIEPSTSAYDACMDIVSGKTIQHVVTGDDYIVFRFTDGSYLQLDLGVSTNGVSVSSDSVHSLLDPDKV